LVICKLEPFTTLRDRRRILATGPSEVQYKVIADPVKITPSKKTDLSKRVDATK